VRAEAMRAQLKLPFPILCEPQREVITAWGLLNSAERGGIGYPAVFIIDGSRTVRYRSLDRTAAPGGHSSGQILLSRRHARLNGSARAVAALAWAHDVCDSSQKCPAIWLQHAKKIAVSVTDRAVFIPPSRQLPCRSFGRNA
jgi:alkyl hydroperoxide reductase subunit AhpC